MFIFKLKTWILTGLALTALGFAEQFVFMPLWGSSIVNVAQWKIATVPLAIEQLDLLYNVRETSFDYMRLGYGVYDMELRLNRLKKSFAPRKIEFLVRMYDQQGNSLLDDDHENNLFVVENPEFSTFNTAKVKLPGLVLDREPTQIKIWIKSYVDESGRVKEIYKPKSKNKNKGKDKDKGTVIIIKT